MKTVNLTIKAEDAEHISTNDEDLLWDDQIYIVLNENQAMDLLKEIVLQLHSNSFEKEEVA